MAITRTTVPDSEDVWGKHRVVSQDITFDTSYPTGGYSITAASLGWSAIDGILKLGESGATKGYDLTWDTANSKLMAFRTATVTPAGTVAAPTFTGTTPTADLNLATPAFSGTGYATSGQVITTTDNQTMTLNQCAGMWFIPPSGAKPGVIIVSNTAVSGAPAVLTVQGVAPTTDAGAYKIVTSLAPVGTNSAPAFTGTATTAAPASQVANATNLSAVKVRVTFVGI
jgi:hypothetical protein